MASSNNPLAPDPLTDLDGPEIFPPIDPEPQEDLTQGVPIGEEDDEEPDPQEDATDEEDPL